MVKLIFHSQGVYIFWLHGKNLLCLQQISVFSLFPLSCLSWYKIQNTNFIYSRKSNINISYV